MDSLLHSVPENIEPIRLYDYCLNLFDDLPSRKSVKKAIDSGRILVDDKTSETGWWLKGGEQIKLLPLKANAPKPYNLNLKIHYEDDDLAIIYKPAGLLVSGNQFKTITNALQNNLRLSNSKDALPWTIPVHRLDKPTSGLLIVAKTRTARISLGKMFENRDIQKEYHAIVQGDVQNSSIIEAEIDDKESITEYELIQTVNSIKFEYLTLVKLKPKTGRKHQLRIHLSSIGHPILGDNKYTGKFPTFNHKGLFLCATKLKFKHPITEKTVEVEVEAPEKFLKRLEREANMFSKKVGSS